MMANGNYFYLDIETVPLDKEKYLAGNEEERLKLLNPIDSKIVMIGIKQTEKEIVVIQRESEAEMLKQFWTGVREFREANVLGKLVGFNVKSFDLPFLVTRSFALNIPIHPFTLKDVIDLRDAVSAYRYGPTRGKLKEFAILMNLELDGMNGENIAETYWKGNMDSLVAYVKKDLEITEAMHQRMMALKITDISKW